MDNATFVACSCDVHPGVPAFMVVAQGGAVFAVCALCDFQADPDQDGWSRQRPIVRTTLGAARRAQARKESQG